MVHIKKMVMHGFKSFAKKTEVNFDTGINVILGPNGSGKSNISDALCFVLGRLSIKSMRAAKAKNLLFMGSKYVKPAREAYVELVFDNKDRGFNMDADEVALRRVVKAKGSSVYKINGETKTRIEVVETLAQAGIDPYGFNLVLQGQIQAIVKMHPDERRKIIEEVAGIAIYELRKEKSMKELEKSEVKLKEIGTILKERTAYLKNLDKERQEALRFKELEKMIKRLKASVLTRKKSEKEKEIGGLQRSIEEKDKQKDKFRDEAAEVEKKLEEMNDRINEISKNIQKSTGLEQEKLSSEIANLKAELEGLRVRKENYENRRDEISRRIEEMEKNKPELEEEIRGLKEESPKVAEKSEALNAKKKELELIEDERKKVLSVKAELNGVKESVNDKNKQLGRISSESDRLLKEVEEYEEELNYTDVEECVKEIEAFRRELTEKKGKLDDDLQRMVELERDKGVAGSEIERAEGIKKRIGELDDCPLCLNKMTKDHVGHVNESQDKIIHENKEKIEKSTRELEELDTESKKLKERVGILEDEISKAELEKIKHEAMKSKKDRLKEVVESEKELKQELELLEGRRKKLEEIATNAGAIQEKYDAKVLEIEEISMRTNEDVETSLLYKQRELEKIVGIIKSSKGDIKDLEENIDELEQNCFDKGGILEEKEKQEEELQKKYKKLFEEREEVQHKIQEGNLKMSELNNEARAVEDQINYLKVGKAKLDAEKEAIEMDLSDYVGEELVQGSVQHLEERLKKNQESLMRIGSINMRALEVYEEVKKEYDVVYEKVQVLEKEKEEILKIIEEIDKKKKRSFMKTFKAMSELFSQNFAQLYTKGVAYLELENKENIFEGGVNIVVRLAKGKYFDVTSLSGGEQTLVALSLLFAIQEYKPYHFYVFDEIDAALDKRNAERLGALLKKYMQSGQYIVVTHNDAVIMNASVLYGVSMHDNVSKILSLDMREARAEGEREREDAEAMAEGAEVKTE